jgi:sugar/nucleoside kinase (ribokinase family)
MDSDLNQSESEVIVAGHICLDVIPTFPDTDRDLSNLFAPGKLVGVGEAIMATGGSVANTGVALHRLGIPTRLMGKVGADKFGETILEILEQVDRSLVKGMIVDEAEETSYTIVISPPGIDRSFLHNPGANDTFLADDIEENELGTARYFHFGYPPIMRAIFSDGGAAFARLMERIKKRGLTTSLDMAFPDPESEAGKLDWRSWLEIVLPQIDIFLPSCDEILFMLDRPAFERLDREGDLTVDYDLLSGLADELLAMGTAVAVLKLGDKGLYIKVSDDLTRLEAMGAGRPGNLGAWQGVELYTPCFQCDVIGTTGAGDCTIAGFLAGLSKDLSPQEVMTMAVAVGGFNVESADATSGIPHWDVVLERVNGAWIKHPPYYFLPPDDR